MKKVAIQLAANPRSFKRCYPFFKANILDTLNPDVFIHTWNLKGKERPDVTTDGSCEEYIELYKPKKFIIEDLEYNYQPLQTMIPHFTSRFKVNKLRKEYEKENNIKYDVVIMGRPDVKLINNPPKNNSQVLGSEFKAEYIDMVEEDSIWIHHFKDGVPSDYFFYTSPKWMDISIDGCYGNLDKLNIYNPGSERLWWHILQENIFKREWFRYYGNSIHDQDHIHNSFRLFDIECIR
jgi:hypothetical protein